MSPYYIALIYAGLGENEQAIKHLEMAYEDRSSLLIGWMNECGLKIDPHWDGVRSDARFTELLRKIGLEK